MADVESRARVIAAREADTVDAWMAELEILFKEMRRQGAVAVRVGAPAENGRAGGYRTLVGGFWVALAMRGIATLPVFVSTAELYWANTDGDLSTVASEIIDRAMKRADEAWEEDEYGGA